GKGGTFDFVLKMGLEEVLAAQDKAWRLVADKDCRLSSVISLIKAAYLTLFHMFGYAYALSGAGYAVGAQILGNFYRKSNGNRQLARSIAPEWFRQYVHMVRPIESSDKVMWRGTIEDNVALTCHTEGGQLFALGVIV